MIFVLEALADAAGVSRIQVKGFWDWVVSLWGSCVLACVFS